MLLICATNTDWYSKNMEDMQMDALILKLKGLLADYGIAMVFCHR